MERKRICLLDLETSGLNPKTHEILEICAIQFSFEPIEFWRTTLIKDNIVHVKVLPTKPIDPFIIDLIKYDEDVWRKRGIQIAEALTKIMPLMKDSIIVGSKPSFDLSFIEKAVHNLCWSMPRMASHHPIDLTSSFAHLWFEGKISKLRQNNVVKYFDSEREQDHTALSDVNQLVYLLDKL